MRPRNLLVATLILASLAPACSPTQEIRTSPPRPAVTLENEATVAERALVTLTVEPGTTSLPQEVTSVQFRVDEVQIRSVDGTWTKLPVGIHRFELGTVRPARRPVLTTAILPAVYDSLSLRLGDVFVQYDANAGGPLTLPEDAPLLLPLDATLEIGRPTTIRLRFEPGASLSRDASCRWYFLPFFEVDVTATS